jgi:hypothetical protein
VEIVPSAAEGRSCLSSILAWAFCFIPFFSLLAEAVSCPWLPFLSLFRDLELTRRGNIRNV